MALIIVVRLINNFVCKARIAFISLDDSLILN